MSDFLQVGERYLNLDLVREIEVIPVPKDGRPPSPLPVLVRVCYANGNKEEFEEPQEIKDFQDYIEDHWPACLRPPGAS